VELQDTLGWYQFSMGQLCYCWKRIQQQYLEFIARWNTGRKWVRELIKKLWGVAWDMCEHQNNILHSTIMPAKLRKIADMDFQIQHQFTIGMEGLLPRDKHWLFEQAKVLKYDLDVKAQWLASIKLARERFYARQELNAYEMRTHRECMEQWLAVALTEVAGATTETSGE
jgi:hypothetical protein